MSEKQDKEAQKTPEETLAECADAVVRQNLQLIELAGMRGFNPVIALDYTANGAGLLIRRLFEAVGIKIPKEGLPLNALYDLVFSVASALSGVDPLILRDRLLYDRLTGNADQTLPRFLLKRDEKLSFVKKTIQKEARDKGKSARVGVGILYSEALALAVFYDERDALGAFLVKTYPLSRFNKAEK